VKKDQAMTPWPIVGHEWATRLMQNAVVRKEVSHAILITGPESIGKRTLARILSKALLCKSEPEQRPCGRCISCRKMDSGNHPDFRLAEIEEGKTRLSVETIRGVERFLALTPVESACKVALITDFEQASINAANALLKTLEEPPAYGWLILLATDADLLLPTVVSRSQQINLHPVNPDKIAAALVNEWGVDSKIAEKLARISGGRAGWAIRAAQDPQIQENLEKALSLLLNAMQEDLVARFDLANTLAEQRDSLPEVLETWLTFWRDVMLLHTDNAAAITYKEKQLVHSALAEVIDLNQTARIIQFIEQGLTALQKNVNAQLLIENVILAFPTLPSEVA
jgi:DNA polymerase-3 subunit delta'